jgi:hypothetical protein
MALGMEYLRRFPTWSEILKPPDEVRGEVMQTVVTAIARERDLNSRKAAHVRRSFAALGAGLVLVAVQAAIVAWSRV